MSKYTVIVESPTKANTIRKFLDSKFTVKASMGHIIDLPKSTLGVDIENGFIPKYIVLRKRSKILKELKDAIKKSDVVYLAPDPDREGEAIAWHLKNAFSKAYEDKKIYRIILHEITKPSVLEALKNPTEVNMDLVNAQQARRILDRIVGYKVSPLLWKNVQRGLSAGRVQSVALRLIAEREKEIKDFIPEEYWQITAKLEKKAKSCIFEAKLIEKEGEKIKLKNNEETLKIVEECKTKDFIVSSVTTREKNRNPSAPFTTSTLQQEASKKLGFTVKKTMTLAQMLYEGIELGEEGATGLITYMRTDSVKVSSQSQTEAREFIAKELGNEYLPSEPPVYKSRKTAQEAHEAIRPTSAFRTPSLVSKYLNRDLMRLYKLIWERFIASQMNPAKINATSVDIKAGPYMFRATGSVVVFDGFLKIYKETDSNDANGKENLPPMQEGETLLLVELIPSQHFTNPPPRYTDALLVKTLEEKGIGRPSTYSPTISTIIDRGYVQRISGKFYTTDLGEIVNSLLVKNFPDIFEATFTATMEEELDEVEEGKRQWKDVLKEFYSWFEKDLVKAETNMENVKELIQQEANEVCEKCGKKMVIRFGRFGKFLACSGFPECRNTKSLVPVERFNVKCPLDGGEIVQRRTKRGKIFYGCSNYPNCQFMTWDKVIEGKCPDCGSILLEKQKKNSTTHFCYNKECKYKKIIDNAEIAVSP